MNHRVGETKRIDAARSHSFHDMRRTGAQLYKLNIVCQHACLTHPMLRHPMRGGAQRGHAHLDGFQICHRFDPLSAAGRQPQANLRGPSLHHEGSVILASRLQINDVLKGP